MRSARRTLRSGLAILAAGVGVSVGALATPLVGHTAPACPATAPGAMRAEVPWPQRTYRLDRLTGPADGRGVLIAVVDSGVDASHPQLTGAVTTGLDALDRGGNGRLDCVGHGTAIASIIAARLQPRHTVSRAGHGGRRSCRFR